MKTKDYTLETLLDLDEFIAEVGQECWVKMMVKKVQGFIADNVDNIKYSLTLHDPHGIRLLGYDNAHRISGSSKNASKDHKHTGKRVIIYNYVSAEQLLSDFWADVENILARRLH